MDAKPVKRASRVTQKKEDGPTSIVVLAVVEYCGSVCVRLRGDRIREYLHIKAHKT